MRIIPRKKGRIPRRSVKGFQSVQFVRPSLKSADSSQQRKAKARKLFDDKANNEASD